MSVALYGHRRLSYQRDILRDLVAQTDDGRYTHPRVLVLMPRQTGKTTTLLCLILERVRRLRQYRAVYAAQQGTVSTRRFSMTGGWIDMMNASVLGPEFVDTRSQGREALSHPRNGSYVMALNPRPGSARSDSLDLAFLDECQEHSHDRADGLEADLGPTFATRPRAQRILAGTATSGPTWWADQIAAARRGEPGAGLLIEVGTWPADADVEDPATWHAHHPGLRHGLTTEDFMASELHTLGAKVFAREYGNHFDDTPDDAAVSLAEWDACTPAGGDPAALGLDVSLDRRNATVVGVRDSGHLEVIGRAHPNDLPELLAATTVPIVLLPHQASVAEQLREAGLTIAQMDGAGYRAACQRFVDSVARGDVHHDHDPLLRAAWAQAARRWHGDTWVLSARGSEGDITPAVAAILAYDHRARGAPVLV